MLAGPLSEVITNIVFSYIPLLGWRYAFFDYKAGGTISKENFDKILGEDEKSLVISSLIFQKKEIFQQKIKVLLIYLYNNPIILTKFN